MACRIHRIIGERFLFQFCENYFIKEWKLYNQGLWDLTWGPFSTSEVIGVGDLVNLNCNRDMSSP